MSALTTDDPIFKARWELIPAPQYPFVLRNRSNAYHNGMRPPGQHRIAYCLVDEDGAITGPSPPTFIQPATNDWNVVVNCPIPKLSRAVAALWMFAKCKPGPVDWQPLGAQLNAQTPYQVPRPFTPLAGWQKHSLQGHILYQAVYFEWWTWPKSAKLATPDVAPGARVLECVNVDMRLKFSWVCNDGETATSPEVAVPRFVHPFDPSIDDTHNCGFNIDRGVIPPAGALGMHVYLSRNEGGTFHRIPAPHAAGDGTRTPESFLWPLAMNRPEMLHYEEIGIEPPASPGGWSYLQPLNLALRDWAGDVIVTEDQSICCPVISEFSGSSFVKMDSGDWGGPFAGFYKFKRRIAGVNGGRWKLIQQQVAGVGNPTQKSGYAANWTLWVENSHYTTLAGIEFQANGVQAFWDGLDHGSSACMYARLEHYVGHNYAPTYNAGIRALWESRGPDDHSPSEPVFIDGVLECAFPFVVEGNQSANWTIDTLTAVVPVVFGTAETAILTQSNAGTVNIIGRLTCDGARSVLALVWAVRTTIQNLWIDQTIPALVTLGVGSAARVFIDGNKLNNWTDWFHVVEAPAQGAPIAEVVLQNLDSQSNGVVQATVYTPRYRGVRMKYAADLGVLASLNVAQPSLEDWQASMYWHLFDGGTEPVKPSRDITVGYNPTPPDFITNMVKTINDTSRMIYGE